MVQNFRQKSVIIVQSIIGKLQIIVGSVLTFIFGFTFIYGVFDDEEDGAAVLIILAILTALAVYMLNRGLKRGKLIKLFTRYVAFLSKDQVHSIDQLAKSTETSVQVVTKNLEYMMKKRLFSNAYIDKINNCVIFQGENIILEKQSINDDSTEYITATCRGCGANNTIKKGTTTECAYCGSLVK
ncbi:MAG: hypothetical protein K0S41_2724 [Anaerocolumna sp.]|jgi:DNA-directed RNA polymerase subunit RPC12/RpoP|nr:hypothetical protein [Anaerocolumna sp.]